MASPNLIAQGGPANINQGGSTQFGPIADPRQQLFNMMGNDPRQWGSNNIGQTVAAQNIFGGTGLSQMQQLQSLMQQNGWQAPQEQSGGMTFHDMFQNAGVPSALNQGGTVGNPTQFGPIPGQSPVAGGGMQNNNLPYVFPGQSPVADGGTGTGNFGSSKGGGSQNMGSGNYGGGFGGGGYSGGMDYSNPASYGNYGNMNGSYGNGGGGGYGSNPYSQGYQGSMNQSGRGSKGGY